MTARATCLEAFDRDVRLVTDGDRLDVRGSRDMREELRPRLVADKLEILEILKALEHENAGWRQYSAEQQKAALNTPTQHGKLCCYCRRLSPCYVIGEMKFICRDCL